MNAQELTTALNSLGTMGGSSQLLPGAVGPGRLISNQTQHVIDFHDMYPSGPQMQSYRRKCKMPVELLSLLDALIVKLQQRKETFSSAEVGTILYGLQGMSHEYVQVTRILQIITEDLAANNALIRQPTTMPILNTSYPNTISTIDSSVNHSGKNSKAAKGAGSADGAKLAVDKRCIMDSRSMSNAVYGKLPLLSPPRYSNSTILCIFYHYLVHAY